MRITYEDLFDAAIPVPRRIDRVLHLIAPLVNRRFPQHFREQIGRCLDHNANKVNSHQTYQMIPNLQEIESHFASEINGSLLR